MTLDRLSTEDVQVLKREGGAIRGHTCKVIVLDRSGGRPLPTLDGLRQHISARLDAAPRLRQRLVATPLKVANPAWLDDPEFDIARHVTRVPENGVADQCELEANIAGLMTEKLDRDHPLWHLTLVEHLEGGRSALVWRIHHCLADGTTSIRLGSAVLWSEDPDPASPPPSSWRPRPGPGTLALLALGALDRVQTIRASVRRSRRRRASVLSSGAVKRELARSAAVTSLAQRVGTARAVGFARAPLEDCRRAGKAIDPSVTINDVVLAVIAGGIGAWLEHTAGPADGIRVKIPVSLHGGGADDGAANRDSYFFVNLPVAETDPAKRVLLINRETRERKLGRDAETLYRLGQHRSSPIGP